MRSALEKIYAVAQTERKQIICMGDFNAKCVLNGEPRDNRRGEKIADFVHRRGLFFTHDGEITFERNVTTNGVTRLRTSRIDFAISSCPDRIQDYRTQAYWTHALF